MADLLKLDPDATSAANAKSEERRGTGFLTKPECRKLIENYVDENDLAGDRGTILVDGPICDAIYRASKKDRKKEGGRGGGTPNEYPTSVRRKELIEKWLERMDAGHALVKMPGNCIVGLGRGAPPPVSIEVEFRQGNKRKFLTRIRGMEEYGIDGEALSSDVARRFACSNTVETNPVGRAALKKGRVELVFQGHLSEELSALLTGDEKMSSHGGAKGGEYHLPKSVVKVALRKGIPARKRQ